MKIVINKCFGGFSLSVKAMERIQELDPFPECGDHEFSFRTNPAVVQAVEELGSELASGFLSRLQVVEVPDGISCHIEEYDGLEHVAEDRRTWG
jgi:hypothetical protein